MNLTNSRLCSSQDFHEFSSYAWSASFGKIFEPVHEISNSVACATSKSSDQPAHMRSLIRAFASRSSIL